MTDLSKSGQGEVQTLENMKPLSDTSATRLQRDQLRAGDMAQLKGKKLPIYIVNLAS